MEYFTPKNPNSIPLPNQWFVWNGIFQSPLESDFYIVFLFLFFFIIKIHASRYWGMTLLKNISFIQYQLFESDVWNFSNYFDALWSVFYYSLFLDHFSSSFYSLPFWHPGIGGMTLLKGILSLNYHRTLLKRRRVGLSHWFSVCRHLWSPQSAAYL